MFTISRFHEILKYFPRSSFEKLVKKHGSDKYSKGFGSWSHLVAMLYGQLSGASSLRTLEAGFNSQCPHYHLGVRPVHRSTLFDANARRSPEVFAEAAQWLMTQLKRDVRNQMKQALCLLDSTSLTLKGRGFDVWTLDQRTRNTQGIKLHLLFEAHTASPLACSMTPANVNDRDEGVRLAIEPGAIYVLWRSENAVKIQILSAMITYALLLIYRAATRFKGRLWMLLVELRPNLFMRPQTQAVMKRQRQEQQQEIARIQSRLFS